jgi:ketosteroid isomerase-like protein
LNVATYATIAAAVAVAAVSACTGEDPKRAAEAAAAAERAAISAQVASGAAAARTKDIDAYMAQFPPEIELRGPNNDVMTREELRAQVLRAWESIRVTRALDAQVTSVILHRDSATVFLTQKWDRLVARPDGKTVDTVITESSRREVWRKTGGIWRSYEGINTQSRTTVNGALVVTVPGLSPGR